jgi:hypothetical protein
VKSEQIDKTMNIESKSMPAEVVEIHIAGDYDKARDICRHWCKKVPRCVTVTKTSFIYTYGEEYPKFPQPPQLMPLAEDLADTLMEGLCQRTAMLCNRSTHEWRYFDCENA